MTMHIQSLQKNYAYNEAFARDAQDFFSARRLGHMGTWRYSEPMYNSDVVNGMHHWAEFVKTARAGSDYYVVNEELEVINNLSQIISSEIKGPVTLIDMGPGSKEALLEKIGPFLRNLETKKYVGVDIVKECLDRIEVCLQDNFPSINFHGCNKDFYNERITYPVEGTPVMVMVGQTIFNLPINPFDLKKPSEKTIQHLKRFKSYLGSNGYLIVTQDCNLDGDDLYKAYMTEADFNLNMLHRIKRDLPVHGNYNPDGFSFEPYWIPETGAAAHTYVARENMNFSIADEAFSIEKGQRFFMHNTYKFSCAAFQKMAHAAGFSVQSSHLSNTRRMAIHVLRVVA